MATAPLISIAGWRQAARGAWRPALVALALVLGFCLFEGAVHSVHHLAGEHQGPECVVAWAMGAVSIVGAGSVVVDEILPLTTWGPSDTAPAAVPLMALALRPGRAPPSAPSV